MVGPDKAPALPVSKLRKNYYLSEGIRPMIKKFIKGALGLLGILVLCFVLLPTGQVSAADGDPYYWAGNSGNWSDVAHWSSTDDGTGGDYATPPNATNDVFFSTNAFTLAGQTVTVDATATCKDMDWTGATNSPTLATTNQILYYYGNATFIAAMSITKTGISYINCAGTGTLTTNGLSINSTYVGNAGTGTLTYGDALTTTGTILHNSGTINTAGQTVTALIYQKSTATAATLTLGNSTVNVAAWTYSGSNLTLTANTSTINCSGNFSGGGLTTYNIVNLTGATSTITGSNTFNTLGLTRAGVQTITFTDGTTQTLTTLIRDASTAVKTLQGSGAAGWAITSQGNVQSVDYISISRSTASPLGRFFAGNHSTDGGNNVGWYFTTPEAEPGASLASFGLGIKRLSIITGSLIKRV